MVVSAQVLDLPERCMLGKRFFLDIRSPAGRFDLCLLALVAQQHYRNGSFAPVLLREDDGAVEGLKGLYRREGTTPPRTLATVKRRWHPETGRGIPVATRPSDYRLAADDPQNRLRRIPHELAEAFAHLFVAGGSVDGRGISLRLNTDTCNVTLDDITVDGLDDLLHQLGTVSKPTPASVLLAQPIHCSASHEHLALREAVALFRSWYLGSKRQPIPYGGRSDDESVLDAWLRDDAAPPRLLLCSGPGHGKSALLVRWCECLNARADVEAVLFPVSIRLETNRKEQMLAHVVSRLAVLHKDEPPDSGTRPDVLRDLFLRYLGSPLPSGRVVLVIIDGLDEASGWDPASALFSVELPTHVRLLASARTMAGMDTRDWLRQLGWMRTGMAATHQLGPLNQQGIAEVLTSAGGIGRDLARRNGVVEELLRLTQGIAFLVGLYAIELCTSHGEQTKGTRPTRFVPEDLHSFSPDLAGFLDEWWADQERLMPDRFHRELSQLVLHTLSCARGALSIDDIQELLRPRMEATSQQIKRYLAPIQRFVSCVGPERRYVFSLTCLKEHIRDGLSKTDRRRCEDLYLAWGTKCVSSLLHRCASPEQVPTYVVNYHGEHLAAGTPDLGQLTPLVTRAWMQAWEKQEHAITGFLGDVRRVRDLLATTVRGQLDTHIDGASIVMLVKCSLVIGAVSSSARIPRTVLQALLDHGIWSPRRALSFISVSSGDAFRYEGVSALVTHMAERAPASAEDRALLDEMASILGNPSDFSEDVAHNAFAAYLTSRLTLREGRRFADSLPKGTARAAALAGVAKSTSPSATRKTLVRAALQNLLLARPSNSSHALDFVLPLVEDARLLDDLLPTMEASDIGRPSVSPLLRAAILVRHAKCRHRVLDIALDIVRRKYPEEAVEPFQRLVSILQDGSDAPAFERLALHFLGPSETASCQEDIEIIRRIRQARLLDAGKACLGLSTRELQVHGFIYLANRARTAAKKRVFLQKAAKIALESDGHLLEEYPLTVDVVRALAQVGAFQEAVDLATLSTTPWGVASCLGAAASQQLDRSEAENLLTKAMDLLTMSGDEEALDSGFRSIARWATQHAMPDVAEQALDAVSQATSHVRKLVSNARAAGSDVVAAGLLAKALDMAAATGNGDAIESVVSCALDLFPLPGNTISIERLLEVSRLDPDIRRRSTRVSHLARKLAEKGNLHDALAVACYIEQPVLRGLDCVVISNAITENEVRTATRERGLRLVQEHGSDHDLEVALDRVFSAPESQADDATISSLATRFPSSRNQFLAHMTMARRITDPSRSAGCLRQAYQDLAAMKGERLWGYYARQLVTEWAECGDLDAALLLRGELPEEDDRCQALDSIAAAVDEHTSSCFVGWLIQEVVDTGARLSHYHKLLAKRISPGARTAIGHDIIQMLKQDPTGKEGLCSEAGLEAMICLGMEEAARGMVSSALREDPAGNGGLRSRGAIKVMVRLEMEDTAREMVSGLPIDVVGPSQVIALARALGNEAAAAAVERVMGWIRSQDDAAAARLCAGVINSLCDSSDPLSPLLRQVLLELDDPIPPLMLLFHTTLWDTSAGVSAQCCSPYWIHSFGTAVEALVEAGRDASVLLSLLRASLDRMESHTRHRAMDGLVALLPLLNRLGGRTTLAGVVASARDVARWWI